MSRSARITSTDYANPYRPRILRAVNAVGGRVPRVSLGLADLQASARAAEGHDDFGDPSHLPPLRVLLRAIEDEARLHFVGRMITRQRLVNLLRNRLRVQKLLAAHPEIAALPLPQVMLITGLQRTGTTTLPSFCSMMCHGRGVFSDVVDPLEVGAHWLRKTARMVQRGQRARAAAGGRCFVDVDYAELVADPMAHVRRIYEAAGRSLTAAAVARMHGTMARNPQHKHGVHSYEASAFGLTPEAVAEAYGDRLMGPG